MAYVKIFHTCTASQVLGLQTRAIPQTVYNYLKGHSCRTELPKKEQMLRTCHWISVHEESMRTPCLQGAHILLFGQPVSLQLSLSAFPAPCVEHVSVLISLFGTFIQGETDISISPTLFSLELSHKEGTTGMWKVCLLLSLKDEFQLLWVLLLFRPNLVKT